MRFVKIAPREPIIAHASAFPREWDSLAYRLNGKDLALNKSVLTVAPGLIVEQLELKGHIRLFGVAKADSAHIGFIDIQGWLHNGQSVSGSYVLSAHQGSVFDAVIEGSLKWISISLPTHGLVVEKTSAAFAQFYSPDQRAVAYREYLVRLLQLGKEHFQQDERVPPETIQILTEQGRAVSAGLERLKGLEIKPNSHLAALALEIENALWSFDPAQNSDELQLEDVAEQFSCSRRKIQMAIAENFGIGFSELRRIIRLHQVRSSILELGRSQPISRIAQDHGFAHLSRFAQHYYNLFETLPSSDARTAPTSPSRK